MTKLNPHGALEWGPAYSYGSCGRGLAVDGKGNTRLTGNDHDDWHPSITLQAFDNEGKHLWASQIGLFGTQEGHGIAFGGSGEVYVTGYSLGGEWPSPLPLNPQPGGGDAILSMIFSPSSSQPPIPAAILFLGGRARDEGNGIACHDGSVYVVGTSEAAWGKPLASFEGDRDVFVAKLKALGLPKVPVARIDGPLIVCRPPQTVSLDGGNSWSPNGPIASYSWCLIESPAGSQARLSGYLTPVVTFEADVRGDYVVRLMVFDRLNYLSQVTHIVRASPAEPPGLALQGTRRQARAWIVRKDYAELILSVIPPASGCELPIAGYRLKRRTGQGDWVIIRDLAPSAFTENNGVLTLSLTDKYLEPKTAYGYRLVALDADGKEAAATGITI